jgi:hypothetical protein
MENTETISVELNSAQHAFLTKWQKSHEQELGIEIPIGAMVRKAVDMAMKSAERPKEDRPPFKPARDRDSRDDRSGPRSFGARPSGPRGFSKDGPSRGGPKFSMIGGPKKFNK